MRYIIVTRKRLVVIGLIILSVIAVGIFSTVGTKAVATAGSGRLIPIYSVDTGEEKVMAISFDAAWGNEDTGQLIDILDEYQVKTTFFVVGSWVDKYPESVKALSDAGHEVMNHSGKHDHMPQLSREAMASDISECNTKIANITGRKPTLFRPPYGEYSNDLIEAVTGLDMYCVQWDVDSLGTKLQ